MTDNDLCVHNNHLNKNSQVYVVNKRNNEELYSFQNMEKSQNLLQLHYKSVFETKSD